MWLGRVPSHELSVFIFETARPTTVCFILSVIPHDWLFPTGFVRKNFGCVLSSSSVLSFLLSLSLLWLDLKAQATCMLRRLDDAPPPPPTTPVYLSG